MGTNRPLIFVFFVISLFPLTSFCATPVPTETYCLSRDAAVDQDGIIIDDRGGTEDSSGILELPSGKIIISGRADSDMALWRLNSNGTLDTTFGTNGLVTDNGAAGGNGNDAAMGMVLDANGKIVLCGFSENGSGSSMMTVWRFNQDGTIDTTFGSGSGHVSYAGAAGGTGGDGGESITITASGKIVVAGYGTTGVAYSAEKMCVWLLNSDGSLDTSFNSTGYCSYPTGDTGRGSEVGLYPGNTIVVAGYAFNSVTLYDMRAWRINITGTLDTSFFGSGYVTYHNAAGGNGNDFGHGLYVTGDGKLIVTGQSTALYGSVYKDDMTLWRLDSSGVPDPAFGTGGVAHYAVLPGTGGLDNGVFVTMNSDGQILVAGEGGGTSGPEVALWKLNYDGTPDTLFYDGSGVYRFVNGAGGNYDYATACLVKSNKEIFVTGMSLNTTPNDDMCVIKLIDDCFIKSPTITPSITTTATLTCTWTVTPTITRTVTQTATQTITPTITPAPIGLTIEKSVSGNDPRAGSLVEYHIKVVNNTYADANNVVIWDTLPPEISYVSPLEGVTPVINGRVISWDYTGQPLTPGESIFVGFTARIDYINDDAFIMNIGLCDYNDPYYIIERHPPIASKACYFPGGRVICFPNPSTTNGLVKFINVIPGSEVFLYTVSGEFVVKLKAETPQVEWDVKNRYGNQCSPGIYYYIVRPIGGKPLVGKIFIINPL